MLSPAGQAQQGSGPRGGTETPLRPASRPSPNRSCVTAGILGFLLSPSQHCAVRTCGRGAAIGHRAIAGEARSGARSGEAAPRSLPHRLPREVKGNSSGRLAAAIPGPPRAAQPSQVAMQISWPGARRSVPRPFPELSKCSGIGSSISKAGKSGSAGHYHSAPLYPGLPEAAEQSPAPPSGIRSAAPGGARVRMLPHPQARRKRGSGPDGPPPGTRCKPRRLQSPENH